MKTHVEVVERNDEPFGLKHVMRLTCYRCMKSLDLMPNQLRDVMRKMRRFRDRHSRCAF